MTRTLLAFALFVPLAGVAAQVPPPPPPPTNPTTAQQPGTPPAQPPAGQRGGGRGRGAVQVMTLTTAGWPDGGPIPAKYTQAGEELSPPLSWSGAPEGTASFVLIVHDLDAMTNPANDYAAPLRDTNDVLHWLVWNIPPTATGLPEGVPQGPQQPDGMRQISQSGPYYRGPAAPRDRSRPSLRLRAVRARHDDHHPDDGRGACRRPRGRTRGHDGSRARQGGNDRTVQEIGFAGRR